MSYRSTSRQFHFQRKIGSSSTRIDARGHGEFGDPIEILPTVKEQYENYKRRARQIDKELTMELSCEQREALRRELAECLRQYGSMKQLLNHGSRLAFEAIFVQVANCRLPKDKFLVLVEEAREIWREKGYADLVPPPSQSERRKAEKKAART